MEEQNDNIVPMYAARVENLTHADVVRVLCTCGHKSAVSVAIIKQRVPGYMPVDAIARVMRCRRCNAKGDCEVDARAALGYMGR